MIKISVIGLGKLGSPLLAACAKRGFEVVGLDLNKKFVNLVSQGKAPVYEPKLAETIKKNKKRITATADYNQAILSTDITLIIVPTPSVKNGSFSNKYVLGAAKNIAKVLSRKNKFHVVVIVSTVMPTSTDEEIIPLLEKASGKKIGIDFGVCYNPEFIALGSVIDNLLKPDIVLIGESDKKSGEILQNFYRKFLLNKPKVFRMSIVNAEIAKISLNSFVTTKISFANTLAQICASVPGGDVDKVTAAISQDSRIGEKYFRGGLAFGGPCFPRDNRAFSYFANKQKVSAPLSKATDIVNKNMQSFLINKIISLAGSKKLISILGLSYKQNTDVVEESPGIKIANELSAKGYMVSVWDPVALNNAKKFLAAQIKISSSLKDCVSNCDILAIMTPWDSFKNINPSFLKRSGKKSVLLDCWDIVDHVKYQNVVDYKTIGQL